jgi:hypothetical protein
LAAQLIARVQELQRSRKSSCRSITVSRRQLRHSSQSNSREKQECEPHAAADEPGLFAKKEPGHSGNGKNHE